MADQAITNNNQDIDKLDGIEILVNWAKSGDIDPWDLDVVDVTDKFLNKLMEIKQSNLRLTGRTLFFAAVLLKLKSDILEGLDPFKQEEELLPEMDESEFDDDYLEEDVYEDIRHTNAISLESAIKRRTSVRKNRTRKVTLEDLIKQLRKLEEVENRQKRKKAEERVKARRSYTHFTPDDILDLAHEEQINDEVSKLEGILSKLFEEEEKVAFNELVTEGMTNISAYLALLFLSANSNIDLVQEEFYSDLYIVKEVS